MDEGQISTRPVARSAGRRWISLALVAVVLLAGGVGSVVLMNAVDSIQQRFAARLMDQNADSITQAVNDEANRYSETLSDLAASVGAQSTLNVKDFSAITSRLNSARLPGASGVAFAVSATAGEIPAVQAHWRDHGVPGLRLTAVGNQPEHMFVVFTESLDNAPANPGRDLSQAPEPLEALQAARTTGMVAASRTYVLLKDRNLPVADRQLSFTLTAPVYGSPGTPDEGRFRGWVMLAMRGGDFIDEVLQTHARDALQIALYDMSGAEPVPVTSTTNRARSGAEALQRVKTVTIGQRTWQLQVQPTDRLLSATDRTLPKLAGGIGLFLTLLMMLLVDARRRALLKVDRTTAELRLDIERRKTVETRLRQSEYEQRHMALHDPLTKLANRTLFYERLEHGMATHHRTGGTLAVLFIDLDGFKRINDELGHSSGDKVLVAVAERLRQCARESDTVARFGGDEFAMITEQLAAPEDVEIVAGRVVRAMQLPFHINGRTAAISCSVGVALHHPGIQFADDLLHVADEAMYAAKESGKDRYVLAGALPV